MTPDLASATKVVVRPIDELEMLPGNPRRGDVEAVKRSLERFGLRYPIVVRGSTVIAGNHRLQAATELGWTEIATVDAGDLSDEEAKAFALADNRTSDLAEYDDEALAEMLADLADADLQLAAGYDADDLADLMASLDNRVSVDGDPDEVPEVAEGPPVTRPGDVWRLGDHRLLCGDCRNPDDVATLLDGATINLAFTSPPYADRRTYDETSGFKPIPPDEYVAWFEPVQANVAKHLAGDGSWFVNIKAASNGLDTETYVLDLVLAHARGWGWHWATEFCWERPGVPGQPARRLKNQFEPVFQFAAGEWKFNPEAVQSESTHVPRYNPDHSLSAAGNQGEDFAFHASAYVAGMAYPGNRLPTFSGSHEATGHSAAFPVGLPDFFVRAYTDEGDTVYDPFMGSGSTLIAAHQNKRIGYGMELSPAYCDIICRRFQRLTGIVPVLDATNEPHDFKPGDPA